MENIVMNAWLDKHVQEKKRREESEAANEEFIERQVQFYGLAQDIGLRKAKEIIDFMAQEEAGPF